MALVHAAFVHTANCNTSRCSLCRTAPGKLKDGTGKVRCQHEKGQPELRHAQV